MRMLIFIFLFTVVQIVNAESLKNEAQAKSLSDEIMQHFLKDDFSKGLAIAKSYWPLPPVEIDGLANQINTQWGVVRKRFGNPTGMELVKEERIGLSFVRFYYLHKFENHAIYWRFSFYKPKSVWKINNIRFKDDLNLLYTTK